MASKTIKLSITKVMVMTGRTSKIQLNIDGKRVGVTVPSEVKAYFNQQFSRSNPTVLQKKKYATIMNLMRAAYLQGCHDMK